MPMPPWMIENLRQQRIERETQDRDSWNRQPSIEIDDPFRRPPEITTRDERDPERHEGGICDINFEITF